MSNSDTDRRRERRIAAGLFAVVAFFVGCAVYHSFKRDIAELVIRNVRGTSRQHAGYNWALARCGSDTERDLATDVIRAGDTVEQLLALRLPVEVETYGPYQVFVYYVPPRSLNCSSGAVVVAKNGIVVWAVTTRPEMGGHVFFDTLTAVEHQELNDLRCAAIIDPNGNRAIVRMSLFGGVGAMSPWGLNQPVIGASGSVAPRN
jgi:hypothetical protein